MTSLPTVVLVHGAWHTPPNYQSYITALQAQGFTVHCPHLPTCNGARPPTASQPDDIACVRALVQQLVDAGKRVLMIMHSYGGVVGTGAVEGLSFAERKSAGQAGGVIHLLYMCAYILAPGSTVWGIIREAKFDHLWDRYLDTAEDGTSVFKDPGLALFSGNADAQVVDAALASLVPFPESAFHCPTAGSSWRTVPTTYVSTTKDYTVPHIYQEIMLGRVREEGVEVKIVTYHADHSLFITMEKEMVQTALEAAADERNSRE
ncbi:uncharacterized protein N7459_005956 [Penicillium hispanicum]|uniref:uncharacterized protein n=1 Tax=Penicillium hispanicum TaxID=1080232 RepID=UPI0025414C83|nr:uncharacterized protein N7459_005956 [Penicillium hispanicum]KAJ5579971.1 hypothetical protein N7459_005956 [Penicillium hispanicum]